MVTVVRNLAPLPAAFTDDGELGEVRHAKMVRALLDRGVEGFLVGSPTAQRDALRFAERKLALEWTLREAVGRPVVVDVSSASTAGSLDLAQHAHRHGATAAVLVPPGGLSAAEREGHLATVRRLTDLPIWSEELSDPAPWLGLDLPDALRWVDADHWACEQGTEALVAGVAAFTLGLEPDRRLSLLALARSRGTKRVARALLGTLGLELGAPRAPVLPLDAESLAMLERLVT